MAKIKLNTTEETSDKVFFYQIRDAYTHGRITLAEIEAKYELSDLAKAYLSEIATNSAAKAAHVDIQHKAEDFTAHKI